MGVDWTQYPDAHEQTGYTRKWTDIHGCEAMTKLLIKMKLLNEDGLPTFYAYYFLWSDGFLRLFIKQKLNDVWILTITFPDFGNNFTSPLLY